MLSDGIEVFVGSWCFARITNKNGTSDFVGFVEIPAMNRTEELTGVQNDKMRPNLFTRRRRKY